MHTVRAVVRCGRMWLYVMAGRAPRAQRLSETKPALATRSPHAASLHVSCQMRCAAGLRTAEKTRKRPVWDRATAGINNVRSASLLDAVSRSARSHVARERACDAAKSGEERQAREQLPRCLLLASVQDPCTPEPLRSVLRSLLTRAMCKRKQWGQ